MNVSADDDHVIVVGPGPCGAAAATQLAAHGVRVVMLDAGLRAPSGLLVRVGGRTLWRRKGWSEYSEHRLDTTSENGVEWTSSLSLGGLSNYWTGAVPRYAPDDFADGARIDERFEWPVTYDELAPYYELIEARMGLTVGDPIRGIPPGLGRYRHRLPTDWHAVAATAQERGHGVGALPMARGRPSMLARRGTEFSSYHCMVSPLDRSPSFRLITGAYVQRLVWSSSAGRVTSLEYIDRRTGRRNVIHGRAFVLAAGAIDTTVIVLRSKSSEFPSGLGNSAELVGRYLHDHLRDWWPIDLRDPMTALAHPVYIARTDHADSEPLMATSLTVGMTDSLRGRLQPVYGGSSRYFGVQVLGTMVPTPDAGVVLDSWAGSRPAIHLRYDGRALQNRIAARDRVREVLGSAGIGVDVRGPFHEPQPGSSVHYAGSVRMHNNPRFGVVDRWNRMHDAPNVAVVDPSCFPTGPEKNPTLTAMALAARAADRLADDVLTGRL